MFFKSLRNYFLTGLLVLLPLIITVKLLVWGFNTINSLAGGDIVYDFFYRKYQLRIPGAGLIILLVVIIVAGLLAHNYFGKKLIGFGESILHRIPVLNSIYGTTKQITEGFVRTDKSAFRKVVMIEYPRRGLYSPGFITGEAPKEATRNAPSETPLFNIFVPTVPNPTTGFLVFVPEDQLIPLDISIEDGFKLIISAGVVNPKK